MLLLISVISPSSQNALIRSDNTDDIRKWYPLNLYRYVGTVKKTLRLQKDNEILPTDNPHKEHKNKCQAGLKIKSTFVRVYHYRRKIRITQGVAVKRTLARYMYNKVQAWVFW